MKESSRIEFTMIEFFFYKYWTFYKNMYFKTSHRSINEKCTIFQKTFKTHLKFAGIKFYTGTMGKLCLKATRNFLRNMHISTLKKWANHRRLKKYETIK